MSIRRPARRRRSSPSAGASAIGRSRSPRRSIARDDPRAALAGEHAVRPRRRAGPGAEPDARRRRGRTPRPPAAADGAHGDVRSTALAQTHWEEADRATFARAWEQELAEIPAFTDSDLHIVTGLLLPIWKRLPDESMRVYRLQTDAGERIIGRLVSPAWVAQAVSAEGVDASRPRTPGSAVLDGRTVLELQDGLELRRAKVMGEFRVELCRLHRRAWSIG